MSRASKITRRRLLATGAAAAAASQIPDAAARPMFMRGGKGRPTSVTPFVGGRSRTFVNTAASATPSDVPILCEMHFAQGDVPTGRIAVPQRAGVDVVYQASRVRRWDTDGSLKSVTFPIAHNVSIAAGGTVQFTFDVRLGSYSNVSAVTPADITGSSDYKLALSNVHTAKVGSTGSNVYPADAIQTVSIGGGQVTGVKVWYPSNLTTDANTLTGTIPSSGGGTVTVASAFSFSSGVHYLVDSEIILVTAISSNTLTYTTRGEFGTAPVSHSSGATIRRVWEVTDGGGSNAFFYVAAGVATVVTPGSGYANVGSGSFERGFNDIVAAVNATGNHASGAGIDQYLKGGVVNAWRARSTISGLDHAHITLHVERWNRSDGTFLAHRACAVLGNGLVDTVNQIHNYTANADWKNGATVIRGVSSGDTRFQTFSMFVAAGGATFDSVGKMDWSLASAAYNAVIPQWTVDEAEYYRSTGVALPWMRITPTTTVPSTPSGFELTSNDAGKAELCTYQPFVGTAGIRSPMGSGGSGNQENPMSEIDALLWLSWRSGLNTAARTWLQNIRVGAAHSIGFAQLGGGFFEPATMQIPNVFPAADHTFTGLTPSRSTLSSSSISSTGYANPLIASSGGTLTAMSNSMYSTYHQVCTIYGAFLIEGEQWQLDTLVNAASTPIFGLPTSNREATFGGRTYYTLLANITSNVRNWAWRTRTEQYAASALPDNFDDGSLVPEKPYFLYAVQSKYEYFNDLVPFVGLVKFGSGGANISKAIDLTGTGMWPEDFSDLLTNDFGGTVNFMNDYVIQIVGHGAFLLRGTSAGTEATNFLNHLLVWYAGRLATPSAQYYHDSYRTVVWSTVAHGAIADPANPPWKHGFDHANPTMGIYAQTTPVGSGSAGVTLGFTSGNNIIAVSPSTGIGFNGSTRVANGTRIKLTTANIGNTTTAGGEIPGGFDDTTWYYLKEITAGTIQLCTDAALTAPVTPTTTSSGVWPVTVPANTIPANSLGKTYRGGGSTDGYSENAATLGTLRLVKYFHGDPSGNLTPAIANLDELTVAMGTNWAAKPQYAWSEAP